MILPIVQFGHPVLRQKGRHIDSITSEIRTLVDDMLETMRHAQGIGLAAQQIGQPLQLFIIEIPADIERPSSMWIGNKKVDPQEHMPMVCINPQLELTKKKETDSEGCLSIPGLSADVTRPHRVKITYTDLEGASRTFEAAGLLGRAIQHEHDHLQGILYIDHLTPEERAPLKEELEVMRSQTRAALASS